MARKKTRKKSRKAAPERKTEAEAAVSDTSGDEAKGPSTDKQPPKPRKKRARKKVERKKGGRRKKGASAKAPAEPLVAEVAVLDELAAGEQTAVPLDEPEPEAVPVEDIDAILDDDDETEDLAALIAQTVADAEPEDHPADEPVESLDEGLIGVVDGGEPPVAEVEPSVLEAEAHAGPPAAAGAPAAAPTPADEGEPEEEIDLTGAIDLGPEITPDLRDRLLAQALAHVELQDARYRVPYADPRPAGRWKALVAAGLLLVAGILAAAPPAWVRPEPPAQLDAAGRARALRTALLLQSQQVDAYRVRYQRLPESLGELRQRIPGLRYVRSGNRAYQIIGYERDGNAIIYDSSNPAPEFGRLASEFEVGGAP